MKEYSKYIIYVDESGDAHWKGAPEFPVLCLNFCLFEKEYYFNTIIDKLLFCSKGICIPREYDIFHQAL